MATRRVVVGSKVGLHARPAALFVQAVNRQPVKVTIAKEGKAPVGVGSILIVLALDVRGGEEIILSAQGDGAEPALDKPADLVVRALDAPGP
jgi:phosphocarrier protein HPr